MEDAPCIGMIGLGLLGSALAERIMQHKFTVVGFDLDPDKCRVLADQGLEHCGTAAEVFERCEIILLSLPTSQIVAALLEENAASLRPGQAIIDSTTGDPAETAEIAQRLAECGVAYIEARVCGSSQQVRLGSSTLLLAGDGSQIHPLDSLFQAITSQTFYLGEIGSASQFKLVHNLILGLNRAVLAEGLQFARSLGFDAAKSLAILLETPAASQAMTTKGSKMVRADYEPHATLAQHLKDVDLILSEARKWGAATPLSQIHRVLLQQAVHAGYGEADNSAIIEAFNQPGTNGNPVAAQAAEATAPLAPE